MTSNVPENDEGLESVATRGISEYQGHNVGC